MIITHQSQATTLVIVGKPPTTPNVARGNFGTFSSFALPTDPYAPFNTQRGSKQVGMAMLGGKLYAGNGDWLHSATNGWWKYTLANGIAAVEQLRLDMEPTDADPFPDSLQDGCGMFPDEAKQTIQIVPGGYFDYTAIRTYSRGIWTYFAATGKFVQDLRICGRDQLNVGTGRVNVGNLYGGAYDPLNNHTLVFMDESNGHPLYGKGVATFDLTNGIELPFQPFTLQPPAIDANAISHHYTSGRFTRIGRKCYFVGWSTNPYVDPTKSYYRMWEWHIDQRTVRALASPPIIEIGGSTDQYIQLLADGDKLVLPVINGPDGGIGHYEPNGSYVVEPMKLLVYDTATDVWAEETGRPIDGTWGGNTFCESPLGVAICGNAKGSAPSHLRFYKVH